MSKQMIFAVALYFFAAALLAGAREFRTHVDYATGSGPTSVATGDFNGDGNLDLVTASPSTNSVSVLMASGEGGFLAHMDYGTGTYPSSVTVGDFNRDGNIDIATANGTFYGDQTVSVLLGNGDGTFKMHVDYPTIGFYNTPLWAVTVGDVNADGILDLLTTEINGEVGYSYVSVLLGNGDGTFQSHRDYSAGLCPVAIAVGDFNKDGYTDLVTADSDQAVFFVHSVSVYLNQGDGTFPQYMDYNVGAGQYSVAVGDFDGDGYSDLVTANQADKAANTASVVLGNGDGSFQAYVQYATGGGPTQVAVADLNKFPAYR